MIRRAVAAVLLAVLLAACGSEPVSGRIVDREHVPAHSWVYMQPIYGMRCDHKGVCSQYVISYVPVTTDVPDRWYLIVADEEGEEHRVEVSRAVYDDRSQDYYTAPRSRA